jgi:hypothetical protein
MGRNNRAIAFGCSLLLAVGVTGLSGCGNQPSVELEQTRSVFWMDQGKGDRVPGLEEARLWYAATRDGQQAIVIWTDTGPAKGYGERLGGSGTDRFVSAHAEVGDGRRVEWRWEARSDGGLMLTINGSTYDPGKGSLLLVSTRGGAGTVLQLDRDLGQLKPHFDSSFPEEKRVAALKEFAMGDQAITAFFSAGDKK